MINSSFYIGKKVGKWGVQFGQQSQQTSGYISNTDFESQKFIVNLTRETLGNKEEGKFSIFYAENQKAFGAQNYYTSAFPDQFEATSTRVIALGFDESIGQKTDFTFNMNIVWGTDRFELYRETSGLGGFDASKLHMIGCRPEDTFELPTEIALMLGTMDQIFIVLWFSTKMHV